MDKHASRLAIPVLRSRVAPVFNWCSKMQIFLEDTTDFKPCHEIIVHNINGFDRLKVLQHERVHTLICGALSPDLLDYGELLGMLIINGISGEVCEVLKAYCTKELNHPRFRLPGCHGRQKQRRKRARSNVAAGSAGSATTPGKIDCCANDFGAAVGMGQIYSKPEKHGLQRQTYCVCPQCGTIVVRTPGISCSEMACSKCGLALLQVDSTA